MGKANDEREIIMNAMRETNKVSDNKMKTGVDLNEASENKYHPSGYLANMVRATARWIPLKIRNGVMNLMQAIMQVKQPLRQSIDKHLHALLGKKRYSNALVLVDIPPGQENSRGADHHQLIIRYIV